METEADEVGLQLASKACFDIREAPVVWAKMNAISEMKVKNFIDPAMFVFKVEIGIMIISPKYYTLF